MPLQVVRFADSGTRYETWELPDAGWADWTAHVDLLMAHAIREIADEYIGEPVEWLEVKYWQDTGRLIVFPSQDGPHGDRAERVCFELSSEHLEAESRRVSQSVPDAEQEGAWEALALRVWRRVSECLTAGEAARVLCTARRSHALRVAGYDYNAGEGPIRLTEGGELV
jgi:hypothetical protein